jgi:hypothetical protein
MAKSAQVTLRLQREHQPLLDSTILQIQLRIQSSSRDSKWYERSVSRMQNCIQSGSSVFTRFLIRTTRVLAQESTCM